MWKWYRSNQCKSCFQETNGLVRYFGEWHTHPQEVPSPSHIDLDEWETLATSRTDRRPLLAGGRTTESSCGVDACRWHTSGVYSAMMPFDSRAQSRFRSFQRYRSG
ncbi:Mov34/MPN/PAD-1 family protein [Pseudomonas sp. B21128]|uniref:Mov34/MPN/PAD-1 family protein n=1 Tax=Pseudomonas TaxID=286 RepID=UPI00209C18A3|nr:Mov34/MPN/PAD-1 family protein [Pseudomonas chlororaphis]